MNETDALSRSKTLALRPLHTLCHQQLAAAQTTINMLFEFMGSKILHACENYFQKTVANYN